ncbi:MAG: hypothetical protein ACR2JF_16530 [Iamia sp.]
MRSGNANHGGEQAKATVVADDVPLGIGVPTGIGSLPHDEPSAAVEFVLEHLPELPAAPSLPARDPRESMLAQAAWGITGVDVAADGSLAVDPARLDPAAPLHDDGLTGAPFVTLQTFLSAVAGRTGAIKVQTTGPVTLACSLVAEGADPTVAAAVAGAAVRARAVALVDAVAAVAPDAPVVAFLDEPGLVGGPPPELGHPDAVVDLVSSAMAAWETRAITGIHCCGPTDWATLLQAGPRILSAPVGADLHLGAGALAAFLERDGWIAWGAVPTDRPLGDSASHWWRELSAQWCELVQAGCDPVRIRRQALVTPACGLARHHLPQAELVVELTHAVGLRIHDQLAGVRLSVGA